MDCWHSLNHLYSYLALLDQQWVKIFRQGTSYMFLFGQDSVWMVKEWGGNIWFQHHRSHFRGLKCESPPHREEATESRYLVFLSRKRPCGCPWSQLCCKAWRSNLLRPWEQRRRSLTRSDKPSRLALSQGPVTWQPVSGVRVRDAEKPSNVVILFHLERTTIKT